MIGYEHMFLGSVRANDPDVQLLCWLVADWWLMLICHEKTQLTGGLIRKKTTVCWWAQTNKTNPENFAITSSLFPL
jgi:hypothetical protein